MSEDWLRYLLWGFAVVIAANMVIVPYEAMLYEGDGHLPYLTGELDLNQEGNFTTWASSFLLAATALGSYLLGNERSVSHPYVSRLLYVMAAGFMFLSVDDVAQFHDYAESLVHGADPDSDGTTPEDEVERMIGPIFAIILAVIFAVGFLAPLARSARDGNVRYLIGCVACVVIVAMSEIAYLAIGCDEDWCFRIEVLFEEGFEFGAIFMMLFFLMKEFFASEDEAR